MTVKQKILHFFFPQFTVFENYSSTTIMMMEEFHDFAMMYLIMIMMFLTIVILKIMKTKFYNLNFMENIILEIIWTFIPVLILICLAYPSLMYLYLFDLSFNSTATMKVFGAQWYWLYEEFFKNSINLMNSESPFLNQFDNLNFMKKDEMIFLKSSESQKMKSILKFKQLEKSSYMIQDYEMINLPIYMKGWRLLETDNRLLVPYGMEVQCLTTSLDVIHSFSVPDLGIKVDAIPGRLNSVSFQIMKPGVFFGQCSEICGTGHAFMPICVEAI